MFVWFATGNVLAPIVAWLLLAVAPMLMGHGHIHQDAIIYVVSFILLIAIVSFVIGILRYLCGIHRRKSLNDWLTTEAIPIAASFKNIKSESFPVLSEKDLRQMSFLLDRALQPVDEFNGFEWLDQFQTAAVRYQINFLGYALSMAQATFLPAFSGYMHEAQRRLIRKKSDYRVWKYWKIENAWGNFSLDPDPIKKENIMFTGFLATQMAMFHAATGEQNYKSAGSFSLSHPSGRCFAYNLPTLIKVIKAESEKSPFQLIACEPNWIYPLCNTIGFAAVHQQAPSTWVDMSVRFRKNFEEEFMDFFGRIIPCRSRYTGIALPVIGGAMPQALTSFFMNATCPDIALRQWLLLRRGIMNGHNLRRRKFWRIDTGNYGFSRGSAYTATALAAAEFGDQEVYDLCLEALDEECPLTMDQEHCYRPQASVWSHATEFFARCAVKDGFRALMRSAEPKPVTPHISRATYPDVMVAAAKYQDGVLKAVFYAKEKIGLSKIGLGGLRAGATYQCKGSEERVIHADPAGYAEIHVMLQDWCHVEIIEGSV